MKTFLFLASIAISMILTGCEGNEKTPSETPPGKESAKSLFDAPPYDAKRGEGKHSEASLKITDNLDPAMAEAGEKIAKVKCFSCHKTTEEKLVGPGWKGVTKRRTPAWIMNFITNPDPMLNKDPEAQAMLEICLVRMPNQNLTDDEARQILEFQRQNDGVKFLGEK